MPYSDLSKNPLFQGLTQEEILKIHSDTRIVRMKFHEGKIIHFQGDTVRELIIVEEGSLSAMFQKYNGKSILVETIQAPAAAATAIVFSKEGHLPVTLQAETDGSLLKISSDLLILYFQRFPRFLKNYMEDMGERVVFLAEKIRYLQLNSLKTKFLCYLVNLSNQQKTLKVKGNMTIEKLSEMLGVARPSLSREIGRLSEEGWFERQGKYFKIHDKQKIVDEISNQD